MKPKSQLLLGTVFFALVIPLIFITGYAGAANYKSDGAVPNGSGGWTFTPTPYPTEGVQCLDCHGTGGWTGIAPDKTSYLKTGHKNMLRKVLPTGPAWNRADGTPYCSSYASCTPPGMWIDPGNLSATFNWASGTITYSPWLGTMLGTPTTVPLYYIVDAWMDPTQMNTIFQGGFTGELPGDYGVNFPAGTYMCARCHTTGYDFQEGRPEPNTSPYGASSLTNPNPNYISGANLSRIPTDFAVVNSAGNIVCSDSTNTHCVSSWYLNGIQCERCHLDQLNEVSGHNCYTDTSTPPNLSTYDSRYTSYYACVILNSEQMYAVKPTNDAATKVCIECHRQETAYQGTCTGGSGGTNPADCTTGGGTWTDDQSITLTTDLMVSGAAYPCSDGAISPPGSLTRAACAASTLCTGHAGGCTWTPWKPATALDGSGLFFDTNPGQTFLNSPHARFSGTLGQNVQNSHDLRVNLSGTYNSTFGSPNQGGCTTCHDVHQSTVEVVGATAPFVNKCSDCHTGTSGNAPKVNLAYLNHHSGVGTPLENWPADPQSPCKICHMPIGTTGSYHLMRISHDPNYSTFPTPYQYYVGGQTIANTAPDGSFTTAVWIDVDLACGQCHGGGTNSTDNPPLPNIPWESKATLAARANGIHNATVDLQISNTSYAPTGAKRGTSIKVIDQVYNVGGGTAGASQTGIYLMTSCPPASATPPALASQIGVRNVPSIPGGGMNSGTTAVTIPLTATVGTNYIVFYADWQNVVAESNKLNNARCKAIVLR